MKVKGLDGRIYSWLFQESSVNPENRSSGHKKALDLIALIFPYDNVFAEVTLPGSNLRIDIVIPLRRILVEVQGIQHYEHVKHFHETLVDFHKSKVRDSKKQAWADLNSFYLINLDCRNEERWAAQLKYFYN